MVCHMIEKTKNERTWKFWVLLITNMIIFVEGLSTAYSGFSEKIWLKMSLGLIMFITSAYLLSRSIDY